MAEVVGIAVFRDLRILFLDDEIPESDFVSVSGNILKATWGHLFLDCGDHCRDAALVAIPLDESVSDDFFIGGEVVPVCEADICEGATPCNPLHND
ncbi:MAG: hypothetical protein LKI25_02245 [Atopobiaceae bacterium]|nr:hypothetical protein [Atopobiaceae bacterium]MCI2173027.1 hypothetical protein [Atopobiaceae bacterium]MCI2208120.1 hypothetical protein [Atopobiaceae bacterium]